LIRNRLSLTFDTYLKFGTLAERTDKQPGIPGKQHHLGAYLRGRADASPEEAQGGHGKQHMKQSIPKRINKFYDTSRFEYAQIRVYHKAARGKHAPRYLLKCGDCDQQIEIHYAEDGLEIGGVHGSIEDWREILIPLLLIEEKNGRLVKHKSTPINCQQRPGRE
jgi:hypothetical protein